MSDANKKEDPLNGREKPMEEPQEAANEEAVETKGGMCFMSEESGEEDSKEEVSSEELIIIDPNVEVGKWLSNVGERLCVCIK